MKNTRNRSQNFMKRGGIITVFLMIAHILSTGRSIPLSGIVSDRGMAVFALTFEWYFVLSLVTTYFLPGFISRKISLRISRGQYKNARKVFSVSVLTAFVTGCILSLCFFFFSDVYASEYMLVPYAGFAFKCICLLFPLQAVISCLCGYFEGHGTMMPTCVSMLIEQLVAFTAALLLSYRFSGYGQKVSALLVNENYDAAYGGAAICFALIIGAVIAILFLGGVYLVYQRSIYRQMIGDTTRNREQIKDLILQYFQTMIPYVFPAFFLFGDTWLNQRFYFSLLKGESANITNILNDYGVYYAKYRPLILICAVALTCACHFLVSTVSKLASREAYHQIQVEFQDGLRTILIAGGVLSLLFTVLSRPLSKILYHQNVQLTSRLLLVGSFAILCYALAIYTSAFVKGLDMPWLSAACWFGCLLFQAFILYLLLNYTSLGVVTLAVMNLIYPLLISGVNLLLIHRKLA
ncbi:MAG: oligosaccharide flippase family protein [Lachnospiraceae bacterium]|nr:oligosaccharide flippase family protein [Lachnospiraceae bacterium]